MATMETVDRAGAISFRQLRLFETIGNLRSNRRVSGNDLNEPGVILHNRVTRFFDQTEQGVRESHASPNRLARSQGRMRANSLPTRLHTDFIDLVRAHAAPSPEQAHLRRAS